MTSIHQTALIGSNVIIEDDVYIGPLCIIGFPPEWKGRYENKGVLIKKGTRITGAVTIDGGAERQTVIGEGCYIMKGVYIAHDCIVGDNVTISAGAKLAGMVTVGDGTNIGMGACVHQRKEIPEGCMIGMNAVITKGTKMLPHCKYAGVPAKFIGTNDRIS